MFNTIMLSVAALAAPQADAQASTALRVVATPSSSPLVAVRLMFEAGSMYDPAGKEGLASLTALMIGQAGTAHVTYDRIIDMLHPLAAEINVSADREVAVVGGVVHRDNLRHYHTLLLDAVLTPGFGEEDFKRNKEQLRAYLTETLRATNDELLGLEAIQQVVYHGHPYGHAPAGTLAGLDAITIDDVKQFHKTHYTRDRLMVGVAGGYPAEYVDALKNRLDALPAVGASRVPLPAPPAVTGRRFTVIEKQSGSVGIHLAYPLAINRTHPDYYPLMVANSFLGEHRTFHGRLMSQLRGKRGLNYGDYSYIEYWHNPPFTSNPLPGHPRRQQYFSVWLRPVVPNTAHFALRNALFEVNRLVEKGMTADEVALTRDFLINYSKLWAQTHSRRLGFAMDSEYYGMSNYIEEIERRLRQVTVEDVNRVVRKYISTDNYEAVVVAADAAGFVEALKSEAPSPMTYNTPPDPEIAIEDKIIEVLPVKPTAVRVIPVGQMFEK